VTRELVTGCYLSIENVCLNFARAPAAGGFRASSMRMHCSRPVAPRFVVAAL
jgi:hypothetical protein